jgi:opacity protein-like surface antigen
VEFWITEVSVLRQHSLRMALVFSCLVLGLCRSAVAQTSISVYTGTSYTRKSDLRIQQQSANTDATFRSVSWEARPFAQAPYYGLRLARFFKRAPHLGLSFDYTHYKIYARTDRIVQVNGFWNGSPVNEFARLDNRVQAFNISHGVNMGGVNLLYRWMKSVSASFSRGRLQPYVGGGPVYYVAHSESTINNRTTNGRYQGSGFGYQLLGGVEYALTRRISIFGEAKFNTGNAKVDTADQGNARAKLRSFHTVAGFSFKF